MRTQRGRLWASVGFRPFTAYLLSPHEMIRRPVLSFSSGCTLFFVGVHSFFRLGAGKRIILSVRRPCFLRRKRTVDAMKPFDCQNREPLNCSSENVPLTWRRMPCRKFDGNLLLRLFILLFFSSRKLCFIFAHPIMLTQGCAA